MTDRWRTRDAIRARRRLATESTHDYRPGPTDAQDRTVCAVCGRPWEDRGHDGHREQVRGGYPRAPGKEVMSKAREVTNLNHALVERAEKGSPARGKPNAAGRYTL